MQDSASPSPHAGRAPLSAQDPISPGGAVTSSRSHHLGPGSLALPAPRPPPPGPAARADAGPPVRAGRTGLGHHVRAPRPTCRPVHGGPRTGRSARLVVVSKGGVSLSRTSPLPQESRPAGRRALEGPSHAPAARRHRCPAVSSLAQRPRRVAVTAGGGSSPSDPLLLPLFLHTAGKRSRPKGTSEVLGRRAGARGLSLRSLTGVGAAPARPTRGHCFFAEDCGLEPRWLHSHRWGRRGGGGRPCREGCPHVDSSPGTPCWVDRER